MSDEPPRRGQESLFGEPESPLPSGKIGPAAVAHEVEAVAAELPPSIRLGTSSWSFPGWEGIVYDRNVSKTALARHGLAAYARHPLLRAVGIDRTFYAPISSEAFAEYADVVPDDFRFLVKASGDCTTPYRRDASGRRAGKNDRFLQPEFAVEQVVRPYAEGLGAKAGPLVFQFPPLGPKITAEPAAFAERLGAFLSSLPQGSQYAVELRDGALLTSEYFHALSASGARHCFTIHPRMPAIPEQAAAAGGDAAPGPLIARWMLHAGLGYEEAQRRYAPFSQLRDEDLPSRSSLAEACLDHALAGHEVIVTANNKAEGSAPLTLYRLAGAIVELVRRRSSAESE